MATLQKMSLFNMLTLTFGNYLTVEGSPISHYAFLKP